MIRGLVPGHGVTPDTVHTVGFVLVLVTFVAFVRAAVAAAEFVRSLWKPLVTVVSVTSAIVLIVFVTPGTLPGLAIDAVLLGATLVRGWRPTPFFGRAGRTSSGSRAAAR